MRFRGRIETERVSNVLLVPAEAVAEGPEGPVAHRRGLFSPEAAPLVLGRRDAHRVEVRKGLTEGDWVALHAGPS